MGRHGTLKSCCWALLALLLAVLPAAANAAPPLKLVVTVGPGSSPDVIARVMAPLMSRELNRPVVVENRTGAGGNIAAMAVQHQKHDGSAAIIAGSATFTLNPLLSSNAGFETKDFRLVAGIVDLPSYFFEGASVEPRTVAGVVDLLKKNSGKFTYAAPPATVHHMAAELLAYKAGFDWTRISFRDPAQQATELLAGRILFAFASLPALESYVEDGRLQVVAVASPQRISSHPEIPSIAETIPTYAEGDFVGLFVPADTPAEAINSLAAATTTARDAAETKTRLKGLGLDVLTLPRPVLEERMREDAARRAELVRVRRLKLD